MGRMWNDEMTKKHSSSFAGILQQEWQLKSHKEPSV